jgi:putative ABC transport system permease protein
MFAAYALVTYWDNSDAHFDTIDRTYVVTAALDIQDQGVHTGTWPYTNPDYAEYIRADNPELEAVVRSVRAGDVSISAGERNMRGIRMLVDPEFSDIFELPFVAGDPETALKQPMSVVLTEETASSLFGDADPIGMGVVLANQVDVTVTGVVREIPEPSHLRGVDFFGSWEILDAIQLARQPELEELPERPENWYGGYCCTTYMLLDETSALTPQALDQQLSEFPGRHISAEQLSRFGLTVGMIPLRDLGTTALDSALFGPASEVLSIVTLLFVLGGLILAVACINYASLATARAMLRSRDVGLRKVVGATRSQVATQYLFESAVLVGTAVVIALLVLSLLIPVFRETLEMDLASVDLLTSWPVYSFALTLLGSVTVAAGAYPAFVLSRVRPVEALRVGKLRRGPKFATTLLVGTQFFAASFLLIMVIVMYSQNVELRRNGVGAIGDPLLVIDNAAGLTGVSEETLRSELLGLPQVLSATAAAMPPWYGGVNLNTLSHTEDVIETGRAVIANPVGDNFFDVFEIPLIAGRALNSERAEDVALPSDDRTADRTINIVVDDIFVTEFGFASPEAAIGQSLYSVHGPIENVDFIQPMRIVGVVENRPLQISAIGANASYFALTEDLEYQIVRLSGNDVPGALAAVDDLWSQLSPSMPRSRRFLDEVYEENYRLFGRMNQIFTILASMAFFISIVGLLGMAIHTANRRRHEIGVRKTLGASTPQVVRMLLRDFGKPVIIANLVTWPLGFLAASAYLSIFLFRIPLTPVPFILSLVVTMLVAWITVAGQALRAARVRPVEVLGCE